MIEYELNNLGPIMMYSHNMCMAGLNGPIELRLVDRDRIKNSTVSIESLYAKETNSELKKYLFEYKELGNKLYNGYFRTKRTLFWGTLFVYQRQTVEMLATQIGELYEKIFNLVIEKQ